MKWKMSTVQTFIDNPQMEEQESKVVERLKELEMRRWLLDEKIDNQYKREDKAYYIEQQNRVEYEMYNIIEEYPNLEWFIRNISKWCVLHSFNK